MALVIDDSLNQFLFSFPEPAANPGPDPQNFSASATFTYADTAPGFSLSASLDPVTLNMGNTDRFGNNLVIVSFGPNNELTAAAGTTGGTVSVDINVPFELYNRLGQNEVLVMEWLLTVTAEGGQSDTTPVSISLTGANDLPTAVNDTFAITDVTSFFNNGAILANDLDDDINDTFTVTNATVSGTVAPGPGTVLPIEFVPQPVGIAGVSANSVVFALNSYYRFLGAGESATFNIEYTMTDGHALSTAFLTVTINGSANASFLGTGGPDILLGEKDKETMSGKAGNDIIQPRGGADDLLGGTGKDKFDFNAVGDSGKTLATRDQIFGFLRGQDKVDLSTIDAKTGGGNDKFILIGSQAFHNVKGELRIVAFNGFVVAEGDTNGNGAADFQIEVRNVTTLVGGDFVL